MANIIGSILNKRYRVDAFIAPGGMGTVYRVWDLERNVPLAMKVLQEDMVEDQLALQLFQREANALRNLTHPHIVPFYGIEKSGNMVYLLARFIDGQSLQKVLKARHPQPLPPDEMLIYLKAVSAALGYSHNNGVVHCDVKPGNVLIDQGGIVYLTDFGIARHADSTRTSLGGAVGTAHYMAPEQIRGEVVTSATDIYAMGVLLFEMLTGTRPFLGDDSGTGPENTTRRSRILSEHLKMPPPDPRSITPDIPEEMTRVVLKALQKEPGERFHNTQEFLTAACQAYGKLPQEVPDRLPLQSRPAVTLPEPPEITLPQPFWKTRQAIGVFVAVGIFGVLGLVLGLLTLRPKEQSVLLATATPSAMAEAIAQVVETEIAPETPTSPPPTATEAVPTPEDTPTTTPSPTNTPLPVVVNPKDGAKLVLVPAGEFSMGSDSNYDPFLWGAEQPSHPVNVDEFWIYQTEVTVSMYQACAAEKACPRPARNRSYIRDSYYDDPQYADYPVVNVTYVDATAYCKWAGGRLPTEAEWEKAARGTDSRLFPWGNDPLREDYANFCGYDCPGQDRETSLDDGYPDTAPVGSFPAGMSPYGALDMAGNVWEWVFDWFQSAYYASSPYDNPRGPASGSTRVIRGGSLINERSGIRTVVRASLKPDQAMESVGFRCAMDDAQSLSWTAPSRQNPHMASASVHNLAGKIPLGYVIPSITLFGTVITLQGRRPNNFLRLPWLTSTSEGSQPRSSDG